MKEKYAPEALVRRLEERLLQLDVRKSAQAVADLLADDFIEFGSSGRIFNKAQIIEALQQERATYRSLVQFKAVVLAPDMVLATYRVVRHGAAGEPPTSSLRSSLWQLRNGR